MKIFKITTSVAVMALAAALAVCGSSYAASIMKPDEAIRQADKMAKSGKLDDALDTLLYSMLEADDSTAWKLRMERGKLFAMKGDAFAALGQMDLAVNGAPAGECVRVKRAELYYALGEPGLAGTDLETAIGQGCAGDDATAMRARLMVSAGDLVGAAVQYGELMDSPEYNADAVGNMGLIYSMTGYPAVAVEYYKIANKMRPGSAGLMAEMADAQTLAGDFQGALTNYHKACTLDPQNKVAANNYAYTLVLAGRTDEAVKIFNEINAVKPNPYSLCNMLEISVARQDWQAAFGYGNMCLKAFSEDPDLAESEHYYLKSIGRALRQIQQDDLAVHPLTQIDLARQHIEYGERADALAAYLFTLMMEPRNTEATFEAGRLMMMLGQYSRGASYLNMSVALSGGDRKLKDKVRRIIDNETISKLGGGWRLDVLAADKQ